MQATGKHLEMAVLQKASQLTTENKYYNFPPPHLQRKKKNLFKIKNRNPYKKEGADINLSTNHVGKRHLRHRTTKEIKDEKFSTAYYDRKKKKIKMLRGKESTVSLKSISSPSEEMFFQFSNLKGLKFSINLCS